jgi:acyl carrier protein
MNTQLESELKALIIQSLNLDEVTPEEIDSEEDLFGTSGLALDSIDALEIGVALQKKYGIKIDPEDKELNTQFKNVRALAAFVARVR